MFYQNAFKYKHLIWICTDWLDARTMI